jgi:hypothetical protein
MKLLTKAKLAREINLGSLFTNFGGTVDFAALQRKSWPYDLGKYKRTAIERGIEAKVPVWYESRTDPNPFYAEDRNYIVLRCVEESRLTETEKAAYQIAIKVWQHLQEKHLHQSAA